MDLCCGSGAISVELFNVGVSPDQITMVDLSTMGMFCEQVGRGTFDLAKFESLISGIPTDRFKIKEHLENIAKKTWTDGYDIVPEYLVLQAGAFGGKQLYAERERERV